MNIAYINSFTERFATICGHDFNPHELMNNFPSDADYGKNDFREIIDEVIKNANKINLSILESSIHKKDFNNFLKNINYPFLAIYNKKGKVFPVIIHQNEQNNWVGTYLENEDFYAIDINGIKNHLQHPEGNEKDFIILSPISLNSLVSDGTHDGAPLTPMKRLFRLLKNEKQDIGYIYIYAIAIGLINLSLPLGIQAIIGLISGGMIFNSVIILISLVIIGTLISGGLQILQISLVETLQKRVFAKASFEFAFRIPKMKTEEILNYYPPELMNRFFDILTIQKGLPKLLIDLSAAMLQIMFGLILLAFYHPIFIVFGIVLIGFLLVTFYVSGPKGLSSSLVESKYKYKIAHWLEEIARTLSSFKLAGFTNLPLQKLDYFLNGYLNSRQNHFKVLILQFGNIILFKTAITGGLLIMGSLLVVNREISLGQFVASEIVIILIINAVEKFVVNLDVIYDLLTAVEKLGNVSDIPLEKNDGVIIDRGDDDKGITLVVKDLKYKYPDAKEYVLNGVNFSIYPGENICIAGYNGSGKNTLLQIISGILENYEGGISINKLSLRDINLNSLRDVVGRYNSKEDIFESNIFDNISMGIARTTINDVNWAIEKVGLSDWTNQLPKGLNTQMISGGKGINSTIIKKIILARAIAEKPNLLVTTDFLGGFEKAEKLKLISLLLDKSNGWSLLSVTNDPALLANCDRILLMEKGVVVAEGTFEQMKKNQLFRDIILD